MGPSKNFLILFGLLAASAAVVFLAVAIDRDVYAPGARSFGARVDLNALQVYLPHRFEHDLTPRRVLRKLYSIAAFAIVGFFAAAMLGERRRALGCVALVACFSAIIEVVQKFDGATEGPLSNAFDIGCGAAGGLIGAAVWTAWQRMLRLPRKA